MNQNYQKEEPPTKSTTYKRVCIFYDKVSKYAKGKDVREKLIQCIDLRADKKISERLRWQRMIASY